MSNSVSEMIENTMKNMQSMVDVNSVIGQPIRPDENTMILPIAKVSYGFGGGGSDAAAKRAAENNQSFTGGIGGGMTVRAEAFLIFSGGNVRIVPVTANASTADKIVDMVPGMVDKVSGFFSKGSGGDNE